MLRVGENRAKIRAIKKIKKGAFGVRLRERKERKEREKSKPFLVVRKRKFS